MAEEYCGANLWGSSSSTNQSRVDSGGAGDGGGSGGSSTSCTTTAAALATSGDGGYGWLAEKASRMADINAAVSFQESKMDASSLQLVGLGLSSQAMDWKQDQPILRNNSEKAENSFRAMLQEGMGISTNFQQETANSAAGSIFGNSELIEIAGRQGFSPSCSSISNSILQGSLDQQNYFPAMAAVSDEVPAFLGLSPPCWDVATPSAAAGGSDMVDVKPTFLSSSSMPMLELKKKMTLEARDTRCSAAKKSTGPESNTKKARNEVAPPTLPPFKVRKEKMGDRITTLQQLVSPFGKTDTASVLSEVIEYVKFLHEQVNVLSSPYLKSEASYQQQQSNNEKVKIDQDEPQVDLRSRGLCLVPIPSTFPVTHEATIDFWMPTFEESFR